MVLVLSHLSRSILSLLLLLKFYLMREILKYRCHYFYFLLFFSLRNFLILSVNLCANPLNLLLRTLYHHWIEAGLLCTPASLYGISSLQRGQSLLSCELEWKFFLIIGGSFGPFQKHIVDCGGGIEFIALQLDPQLVPTHLVLLAHLVQDGLLHEDLHLPNEGALLFLGLHHLVPGVRPDICHCVTLLRVYY
jgi:hypothetical protein